MFGLVRKVLASRNRYSAKPLSISRSTISAIPSKGVLGGRSGVASDLLQGIAKVLVHRLGIIIVLLS